jgi:hypothetical protein
MEIKIYYTPEDGHVGRNMQCKTVTTNIIKLHAGGYIACKTHWEIYTSEINMTGLYVPKTVIRRDLQIQTVKEEIRRYSSEYSARLSAHPKGLVANLMEQPDNRRLRRHLLNDLPTRF